ncbi:Rabphilin 3A-like (without C2 domains) [Mactra antiquata]
MDGWVCPNDRQLALRAKLGTGWSVHTNKFSSFQRSQHLSAEEQEQIMNVIQKADYLEMVEQERIGRLVEKLDNMKKNAMGNGTTQCVLCGDEFGLLGASPTYCDDCHKAVCSKCGVDTQNCHRQPLWLCKICSENREVWKRSGAWFFKGLPKYVIPEKKIEGQKHGAGNHKSKTEYRGSQKGHSGGGRPYNNWSRGTGSQGTSYGESGDHDTESSSNDNVYITGTSYGESSDHDTESSSNDNVYITGTSYGESGDHDTESSSNDNVYITGTSYGESSDHDTESSSDDDVSIGKRKVRQGSGESDAISMTSSQSGHLYSGQARESKSSITSDRYGHGHISATESLRDEYHEETDNDSIGGSNQHLAYLNIAFGALLMGVSSLLALSNAYNELLTLHMASF